jgi:hypothetical protein
MDAKEQTPINHRWTQIHADKSKHSNLSLETFSRLHEIFAPVVSSLRMDYVFLRSLRLFAAIPGFLNLLAMPDVNSAKA